jgi:hypothetical protein
MPISNGNAGVRSRMRDGTPVRSDSMSLFLVRMGLEALLANGQFFQSEILMIRLHKKVSSLRRLSLPLAGLAAFTMAGCADQDAGSASTSGGSTVMTESPPETSAHAEHDHPSEGPHHGDLVELGNEEYHGEVVHGEGGSVSVYILDSSAKLAVPIDAAELTINITHEGNAEQFKLPADRDATDPEGKSSRFTLKDEELSSDLDSHDAAARLVVTIDGKSFSGKIVHSHEGEHAHDDGHKH